MILPRMRWWWWWEGAGREQEGVHFSFRYSWIISKGIFHFTWWRTDRRTCRWSYQVPALLLLLVMQRVDGCSPAEVIWGVGWVFIAILMHWLWLEQIGNTALPLFLTNSANPSDWAYRHKQQGLYGFPNKECHMTFTTVILYLSCTQHTHTLTLI